MPRSVEEFEQLDRQPRTVEAFEATDTTIPEPQGLQPKEDLFDERVPMLSLPRFKPEDIIGVPGTPLPTGKAGAFIANLPIAAAELGINLPGWLMEMTRQARYGGDEPTELDVLSPEGKLQVPEMVRGLVAPSAKLAAGIKTRGETKAGKELFEEALGETVAHPESVLLPFLIAAGARGAGRGRAVVPKGKAKPTGILSDIIPKERIPTERVPIVEEVLGVEKVKVGKDVTLYRGTARHQTGKNYYSPDKEFARQFTQSGLDSEIKTIKVSSNEIYRPKELPDATRLSDADLSIIREAKDKGFKGVWMDEGLNQPESVYMVSKLKPLAPSPRGVKPKLEVAKREVKPVEAPKVEIFKAGDRVTTKEGSGFTIVTMKKDGIRAIVKADVDGRTGLIKLSELSKQPKAPSPEGAKAETLNEYIERTVGEEPLGVQVSEATTRAWEKKKWAAVAEYKAKKPSERGAIINPFQEITTATSEMIQKAKAPPEITAGVKKAKEAMIEHDRQIRRSESTSKLFENTVNKNIPKDKQMTMVHAYEQKMQGKHWDQLSPLEKKITEWAAGEKAKLNQFIKDNDVLEMMPEQEGINHIFHHWIDPKTGQPFEAMYGKFSKGLPQAKQRTIPTYEAGQTKGMTPATTNLGKLIGLEWESVMRAHQSRQMFKTLHNVGADSKVTIQLQTGKKPKPIRMVERWDQLQKQGLTDSYIRYDHWALDKAITFKDANGTLIRLKGAVGIRKELHPFVRAYLENPNYNTLDQLNFATKSAKLGMSMFHVVSLGAQEIANWRIPFKNIPRGRRLIKELDPDMRLLHQEGLDLWKGYEDIGYQKRFFPGKTWIGKTGNVAAYPITLMRSLIFDVIQPGMKASFAYDKFQKVLPKYLERGLTKEQAARAAVKAADGHFSHEHWKRSLLETNRWMVKAYFSPESRRWWQRMLLSPTWQREHLLVAKDIAKSFMPDKLIRKLKLEEMGPIKSEYRKYALGAFTMIAAVDLYNLMATKEMDGEAKHLWQNPPGKGFAVRALWNEPSYTVKTKEGKKRTIKGGKGYFRPLKSVYEVAESARDPIKKLGYKVSPMISAIGQQFWPSKYRREYKGIEAMPRRALDFVLDIGTPIQVGQTAQLLRGKKSLPGAILPFFGMPTSKLKEPKKKKTRSILSKIGI